MPKQKLFLVASNDSDSPSGFRIEGVAHRHQWYLSDEDIKLGEVEVEVPHPSNLSVADLRLKAIATLQEKQRNARVEAQKIVNSLQEKIQALQQLTYVAPTYDTYDEIISTKDGDVLRPESPTAEEIVSHAHEFDPAYEETEFEETNMGDPTRVSGDNNEDFDCPF